MLDAEKTWVDRLSLALALQSDGDPRVEKELERLVEEMQWKDSGSFVSHLRSFRIIMSSLVARLVTL